MNRAEEIVALEHLAQDAVESFSEWARNRGVELGVVVGEVGLRVRGVRVQLMQALQHVMINAVESCRKDGGEVVVRLRRDQELAVMEIADRGGGMEPETWARTLEPGLAQGMADADGPVWTMTKRIILQHLGCMALSSWAGGVTRTTIWLPLCLEGPSILP
ncbi:MAG: ATP-binding protein [Kiritimatiellae bacterium]|nr:ATP-binding protein [Kiritimatiellia bacterium]